MTDQQNPTALIPERPILVYPSLATTIGLEEATMLSILNDLAAQAPSVQNNNYTWYNFPQDLIANNMPFWQPTDVQRICTNLREQGIIIIASAPYTSSLTLKFAFNQQQRGRIRSRAATPAPQQAIQATNNSQGMNYIASSWQPDRNTLQLLAQHNVPEQFAMEQVPEFVSYWRERNEPARAWGSKFLKQVLRKWREFEAQQNARKNQSNMHKNWRPSEDAIEVLTKHGGISLAFIEDAIPEFELYWREQGSSSDNWNRKFRDHVHRQWLRYCSALEHDTTPRRIPPNWEPSRDVYDVLSLANIDLGFARELIKEFIIYWQDSNQIHTSWNTKFLQYVKKRWANQGQFGNGTAQQNNQPSTRDLSLSDELNDRTWATQ